MKKFFILFAVLLSSTLLISNAYAISVAGYDFDDNAFVDDLLSSYGSYSTYDGDLESQIVGYDLNDYAFSFTDGAYVEVGFTDNLLFNGSGYDLAIFELGIDAKFDVYLTMGGITNTYTTFDTGYDAIGYNVNVALVDLDDFGLASGTTLASLFLGMDNSTSQLPVPSLTAVGALNSTTGSVPEPATMLLLGTGLVAVAGIRRKINKI